MKLFTVAELAVELACSKDLIYKAMRSGDLEASRLGYGVIRISEEQRDEWLRKKTIRREHPERHYE